MQVIIRVLPTMDKYLMTKIGDYTLNIVTTPEGVESLQYDGYEIRFHQKTHELMSISTKFPVLSHKSTEIPENVIIAKTKDGFNVLQVVGVSMSDTTPYCDVFVFKCVNSEVEKIKFYRMCANSCTGVLGRFGLMYIESNDFLGPLLNKFKLGEELDESNPLICTKYLEFDHDINMIYKREFDIKDFVISKVVIDPYDSIDIYVAELGEKTQEIIEKCQNELSQYKYFKKMCDK